MAIGSFRKKNEISQVMELGGTVHSYSLALCSLFSKQSDAKEPYDGQQTLIDRSTDTRNGILVCDIDMTKLDIDRLPMAYDFQSYD